ncbi:MAG TPA: imidazolonepropionase [Bryobacteraceae bacterium]|nr:imidazolonepropionase [Bryobacteraceae bacterium]HOL71446.1 imidazolonepropionase [Bryobacteraceae bacterium]HOQ45634.1 imidazolonepropionase [Bryobacteraceae bacterium]HPU71640.1 imidazolonepropionase [Bryobacteraceae bacterium]
MPVLVRGARQLLTMRGPRGPRRGEAMQDLGIVPDGAVLIRGGKIVSLGPSRRVENLSLARHAREIDATGRVVAPGFVDSHTHLVCGPARLVDYEMILAGATYREIAAVGGGILASVRAVREMPIRRLLLQAKKTLAGCVAHGTTTLEAKSGYGLDEKGERKALRAVQALQDDPIELIPTYLGAHAVPPEYAGRADDYIDWMCRSVMPKLKRRKLARFVDIYCDEDAFTIEQGRRYLSAAKDFGFGLKVHAEQFSRTGAAMLAVEMGAASADHLAHINDDDARALAASDTIATLLPGSVFHLGLDCYPPARKLIKAGAAVALATDYNPGTSPTYNMQMVLSLACSQMRMTPAEAFCAATINGAYALHCGDHTGSIETGKDADLVMFDVPDYREVPYHFGVNLVVMTMKRGVVLYGKGNVGWDEN